MSDFIKTKTVDSIEEVANGSFGAFGRHQVLLHEREIDGDYAAVARYFLEINNVGEGEEARVSLDQLSNLCADDNMDQAMREAAMQMWIDLRDVRAYIGNAELYVQGIHTDNYASKWHHHGFNVERTVLCKYTGEPTEMAQNKDVTSWGEDNGMSLVVCDVNSDAVPLQFNNGSMFAMAGNRRLFGKPTVHRKPPVNEEPSLLLIAEPE